MDGVFVWSCSTSTVRCKCPGQNFSMFLSTNMTLHRLVATTFAVFFLSGSLTTRPSWTLLVPSKPTAFTILRAIRRTDPISPTLCTLHDGTRPEPVSSNCMVSILWPFGWQVLDSSNYPTEWDWGCLNCGAAAQWQDFLSAVLHGLLPSFPTSDNTVNVGSTPLLLLFALANYTLRSTNEHLLSWLMVT